MKLKHLFNIYSRVFVCTIRMNLNKIGYQKKKKKKNKTKAKKQKTMIRAMCYCFQIERKAISVLKNTMRKCFN